MNCIIIDDDKMSRMIVEKFIEKTEFLNLIKSFENAIEAISLLNSEVEPIDLIFLDVEMPEMNGIEFLQSLRNLPQIIIISGKEKYALEAFEYDVTDYILKPPSQVRLFKAVDKAYNRYREMLNRQEVNEGIFIKSSSTLIRVQYDEIYWVEALENYVVINTFDKKHTIHFTMKAIDNKLPPNKFIRVHRSFIVNINKISLIEDNTIIMKTKEGNRTIPIAKSYKDKLLLQINIILK